MIEAGPPQGQAPNRQDAAPHLRRVLGLGALIFYGLSVIVGAGIYVAIGAVIQRAGDGAPLSFLVAGIPAALTGLCYAELAGRYPEAGGAAAYVRHCFGSDRLAQVTGAILTLTAAAGAASIAKGAAQYMSAFLPIPEAASAAALIVIFSIVASIGVRESVGLAALTGIIELIGLGAVATGGFFAAPWPWHMDLPATWPAWNGVLSGAFIAFFAFLGFETLANIAEEVRDPHRIVPRGIVGAIIASVFVYVVVALAVVVSEREGDQPLLALFTGRAAIIFAVVGFLAVANGVLVHIVMLARLFYGMARVGELPAFLAKVNEHTRTPLPATALSGGIILTAAFTLPFEDLLRLTNALTLSIFALVNLALWRAKKAGVETLGLSTPAWLPPLAAVVCLALIAVEALR